MSIPMPFHTPIVKELKDIPFHTMTPQELHEMRNGSNGDLFFSLMGYPRASVIAEYEVGFFGILVPTGIFPLVRILVKPKAFELYSTDHKIYVCGGKRIST